MRRVLVGLAVAATMTLATSCGDSPTRALGHLDNLGASAVLITPCHTFESGHCTSHGGTLRLEPGASTTTLPHSRGSDLYVVTTPSGRVLGCLSNRVNGPVDASTYFSVGDLNACPGAS